MKEIQTKAATKAAEGSRDTVDRILLAATRLFAERGFDGVSTREIAAAVGLNIATVNYHVGGKSELYATILLRIDEIQAEIFMREVGAMQLETGTLTAAKLGVFIDRILAGFVALALEHPEGVILRVRQALDVIADGALAPNKLSGLILLIEGMIDRAKAAGIVDPALDARMFTRGYMWLMQGYFIGAPRPGERRIDPADPVELAAFRTFIRRYTFTLLGLAQ